MKIFYAFVIVLLTGILAYVKACNDDSTCGALQQTFESAGKDICAEKDFQHFCNKTCSLCKTTVAPLTTTTHFDVCTLTPCKHGTCHTLSSGSFACSCNAGFMGLFCDQIDVCSLTPCNHGSCHVLPSGSFNCSCNAGFAGLLCDKHDPCSLSPCLNGICQTIATNGTFTCDCSLGYSGLLCEKADICDDDSSCSALQQTFQAANEDICKHNSLKYLCNETCGMCHRMATISPTTTTVTAQPASYCITNPCVNGACIDVSHTFVCICDAGYTGKNCTIDVDECSLASLSCMNGGVCTNTPGDYTCNCTSGWTGNTCDIDVDECSLISPPCQNGGVCTNHPGDYSCECTTGWSGANCSTDVDECSLGSSPCLNGGVCTNSPGGYYCNCTIGWTGTSCDIDVDECSLASPPCQNGGVCTNTPGYYTCNCTSGWTGNNCSTDVDECSEESVLCLNGGTCINTAGGYSCKCAKGWSGTTCNHIIKDCEDILNDNSTTAKDGVNLIRDSTGLPVIVLCDMHTEGGGWTVLMSRMGGTEDFPNRSYDEYEAGFGHIIQGDFWTGLQNMHNLTSDGRRYQLRVELQVANGTVFVANYDDFSVGPPDDFVLRVGKYHGNAGDSLSGHNGFGFTTKEVDHDSSTVNCGVYLQGGWWFHSCHDSCLTCPYQTPGSDNQRNCRVFSWDSLGYCIALKSTRLMMRSM